MPRFLSISQDGMPRMVAPMLLTLKRKQKSLIHQLQKTLVSCDLWAENDHHRENPCNTVPAS